MDVMDVVIIIALILVGVCMGSFAGALVWRLRARQLTADKKSGEKVDAAEYKKLSSLTKKTFLSDRSQCLHCGYELRWYDLVPIVSWLSLKGKCRRCRKPIGYFEPLIEVGVALFFVVSFLFWPIELTNQFAIIHFGLWLVSGVLLAVLWAYDFKWFLLPDSINIALAVLGAAVAAIIIFTAPNIIETSLSVLASVGVMAGLYGLLYLMSKGRWVGFGDVKLGVGLGLLLSDWQLAVVALFAANFLGTLIVLPGVLSGKLKSGARVPFGPLLITGTAVSQLFGAAVVSWYAGSLLL